MLGIILRKYLRISKFVDISTLVKQLVDTHTKKKKSIFEKLHFVHLASIIFFFTTIHRFFFFLFFFGISSDRCRANDHRQPYNSQGKLGVFRRGVRGL